MPPPAADVPVPDRVDAFRLWTSASLPSMAETHPHHELIIPTRGIYRVCIDAVELEARPGHLVGFPAGMAHRTILTRHRGTGFIVVQWWGGPPPWRGMREDHQGRGRMTGEWLVDAVAAGDEPLARRLAGLLASPPTPRAMPGWSAPVARLCDEMRAKLGAPLTIADLAALAGWTPQHLIRRFREETGSTPMAWLQEQRLRRARVLLENGEDLARTARRCGYQHDRNLLRALRERGI